MIASITRTLATMTIVHFFPLLLRIGVLVLLPLQSKASSPSSYTPVTALDKFGNAQQVRNAREAALQNGRLVVAAKFRETTSKEDNQEKESIVVVLTLVEDRPDVVESSLGSARTVQLLNHLVLPHPSTIMTPTTLEHLPLSTSPTHDHYQKQQHNDVMALACTGIKPDAIWLIETIRNYVKRVWERYDTFQYSVDEMANAISQAMGSFWNHPQSQEWNHGAGPVVVRNNDEEDDVDTTNTWARPLGVQVLVLSTNPCDPLVVVEPSGVAQASSRALAIGQYSEEVLPQLLKKLETHRQTRTCEDLIDVMIQTVRQTLRHSNHKKKKFLIEILSSRGVERRWHA
jgi:20S proteasome alpha/beta subunit